MARRTTEGHAALESGPTDENLLNETDGSFRDFAVSNDFFWKLMHQAHLPGSITVC